MKIRIFLDLDGVMADLDSSFKAITGMTPKEADDRAMFWKTLEGNPRFFRNLELMHDAHILWEAIKHHEVIILTAIPRKDTMPHATQDKHDWVKEKLGDIPFRVGPHARNKCEHCEGPLDVLIDDKVSNIEDWIRAGGVGILHTSAAETLDILTKLLEVKDEDCGTEQTIS